MPLKKSQNANQHFEKDSLNQVQVRLLRSFNIIVNHLLTTADEAEYFESSAESMRLLANMIQEANFASFNKNKNNIPYDEQALEYSIDILNDQIQCAKVTKYDN